MDRYLNARYVEAVTTAVVEGAESRCANCDVLATRATVYFHLLLDQQSPGQQQLQRLEAFPLQAALGQGAAEAAATTAAAVVGEVLALEERAVAGESSAADGNEDAVADAAETEAEAVVLAAKQAAALAALSAVDLEALGAESFAESQGLRVLAEMGLAGNARITTQEVRTRRSNHALNHKRSAHRRQASTYPLKRARLNILSSPLFYYFLKISF
jgi:hypothetical protein